MPVLSFLLENLTADVFVFVPIVVVSVGVVVFYGSRLGASGLHRVVIRKSLARGPNGVFRGVLRGRDLEVSLVGDQAHVRLGSRAHVGLVVGPEVDGISLPGLAGEVKSMAPGRELLLLASRSGRRALNKAFAAGATLDHGTWHASSALGDQVDELADMLLEAELALIRHSAPTAKEALEALTTAFDRDAQVELAELAVRLGAGEELRALIDHPNPVVATVAADAVDDWEALEALSMRSRSRARACLALLDREGGVQPKWIREAAACLDDPRLRARTLRTLGRHGGPAVAEALEDTSGWSDHEKLLAKRALAVIEARAEEGVGLVSLVDPMESGNLSFPTRQEGAVSVAEEAMPRPPKPPRSAVPTAPLPTFDRD